MMSAPELLTASYERAAEVGLQTNTGPDKTAFLMEQFYNEIVYCQSVDNTVRAEYLLDVANRKF
jgi:hypothetical protein